jgi:hypothetical protein
MMKAKKTILWIDDDQLRTHGVKLALKDTEVFIFNNLAEIGPEILKDLNPSKIVIHEKFKDLSSISELFQGYQVIFLGKAEHQGFTSLKLPLDLMTLTL